MNARTRDLLSKALELSATERAELAALLFDSLETESDPDAEAAWLSEIERRMQLLDAGHSATVPWSDVRARLFAGMDG